MTDRANPFEKLYDHPGHLIRRLQQIAVALFKEETRQFDLTPVQYATLTAIRSRPGIENASLVDVVALDRSTIGDVVLRLERRGLVARSSSKNDRRLRPLKLTAEGERLLDEVEVAVERTQDRILAPLPPGQRRQFKEMLVRVVNLNNEFSRVPLRPESWKD